MANYPYYLRSKNVYLLTITYMFAELISKPFPSQESSGRVWDFGILAVRSLARPSDPKLRTTWWTMRGSKDVDAWQEHGQDLQSMIEQAVQSLRLIKKVFSNI